MSPCGDNFSDFEWKENFKQNNNNNNNSNSNNSNNDKQHPTTTAAATTGIDWKWEVRIDLKKNAGS